MFERSEISMKSVNSTAYKVFEKLVLNAIQPLFFLKTRLHILVLFQYWKYLHKYG